MGNVAPEAVNAMESAKKGNARAVMFAEGEK